MRLGGMVLHRYFISVYNVHIHVDVETSEQTSVTYKLDHLATFSATADQGRVKPSDVMDRLKEMEASTGVWAMKVILQIDRRAVVVKDADTHKVQSINRIKRCETLISK